MKALVLGGAGFIGKHSVRGLVRDGHAVRIFARPTRPRFLDGRLSDVPANVLNISRATEVLGWEPAMTLGTGRERSWQALQRGHD